MHNLNKANNYIIHGDDISYIQDDNDMISDRGYKFDNIMGKLQLPHSNPQTDHTLPGFNYLGPGTHLCDVLGIPPIDKADQLALRHDMAYNNSKSKQDRLNADLDFIPQDVDDKDYTFIEKVEATVAAQALQIKAILGLDYTGQPHNNQLINDLYHLIQQRPKPIGFNNRPGGDF